MRLDHMGKTRERVGAFCVSFVLVMTTMLYALQAANMPLVQVAFADTLHFGQVDMEQPAIEGETLGSMVESQVDGVAREARVEALISKAEEQLGKGYARGGAGPNAFDCSGLVQYCAREALAMDLPHSSAAQSGYGTEVAMEDIQRGDLLFWGGRRGVHHVGIYLGDGEYIHAAGSGKGVRVSTFDYYAPSFAKRVL